MVAMKADSPGRVRGLDGFESARLHSCCRERERQGHRTRTIRRTRNEASRSRSEPAKVAASCGSARDTEGGPGRRADGRNARAAQNSISRWRRLCSSKGRDRLTERRIGRHRAQQRAWCAGNDLCGSQGVGGQARDGRAPRPHSLGVVSPRRSRFPSGSMRRTSRPQGCPTTRRSNSRATASKSPTRR